MTPVSQTIVDKNTCSTCKHFGGQGRLGVQQELTGKKRTCMAYLFDDMDNTDFRPMPDWVVTWGSLGSAKGVLQVHETFGCINYNNEKDF